MAASGSDTATVGPGDKVPSYLGRQGTAPSQNGRFAWVTLASSLNVERRSPNGPSPSFLLHPGWASGSVEPSSQSSLVARSPGMSTFVFDDYYGDERPGSSTAVPTYLPAVNQWDPIGGTCPSCTLSSNLPITIDASKVQNGTWHSTTVSPGEPETTISITFNGERNGTPCSVPS